MTTLNKDKKQIASMFDNIASRYDFLNHALSFNIDKLWRKRLKKRVLSTKPKYILDLATGTGDVAMALYKEGEIAVVGMDISKKMLDIAKKKASGTDIKFVLGPADNIPFEDNTFDALTISFGIRNFDNREKCINELYRVLKPGAVLAILEFTIPKNILWRFLYTFYFKRILPLLGRLISKDDFAYKYLPASAFDFPQRGDFCKELKNAYFIDVKYESLTGGVACLYLAKK